MSAPSSGLMPTAGRRRLRALIVEDEILIAWHLQELLDEIAIEASDLVSSGGAALELVCEKDFDVVFMDVNLAGSLDGVETARRIRAKITVPIIFVTAYAAYDDISSDLERLGLSAVVSKPAMASTVHGALREVGLLR